MDILDEKYKQLNEMLVKFIAETKEVKELVDEAADWDSLEEVQRNIAKLTQLVDQLILAAMFIKDTLKLNLTEDEVLDFISKKIELIIELPWLAEKFDGVVIRLVLGLVWNKLKVYLPKIGGKDNVITGTSIQGIQKQINNIARVA